MTRADLGNSIIVVCHKHPQEARNLVLWMYRSLGEDYPPASVRLIGSLLLTYDPAVLATSLAGRKN